MLGCHGNVIQLFSWLWPKCFLSSRIWSHSATVWRREGLLHHLLGDWHPFHPPLPHRCRAKDHGVQHTSAYLVHPQAVGPVKATGGHRSCHCAGRGGRLLLPPHPCCHFFVTWGELELPGVLLFLLHFPQHNWPGRLRTWRSREPEEQGALQAGHHWWVLTLLHISIAALESHIIWFVSHFFPIKVHVMLLVAVQIVMVAGLALLPVFLTVRTA